VNFEVIYLLKATSLVTWSGRRASSQGRRRTNLSMEQHHADDELVATCAIYVGLAGLLSI
jgi:hypothetical protein